MEPEFRPYVNLPPMTKTRSTSHLAPVTPEHHRSASCEDTASSSSESAVRIRPEIAQRRPSLIPSRFVVAYEYVAQKEDELNLPLGSIVRLITTETNEDGWYKGDLDGRVGLFPSNYVRPIGEESNLTEFSARNIQIPPPFRILDECQIGFGATATVFKVDIRVHRTDMEGNEIADEYNTNKAALKRFNMYTFTRSSTSTPPYELLKREANLVNGLQHANIVRLLGVCTEKPYFGLLLELCEGGSLRSVYHQTHEQTIPFRVLVDWALQIASGMEYLIAQGYIHRDLKADNVLVKEEVCFCFDDESFEWCHRCGRRPFDRLKLKITDFGVTRELTDEAINRQSQVGTCAWLSPEAFRGTYSEASDVWSFGVVLWELLSKEEPYQGQVPASIMFQTGICGKSLEIDKNCPAKWRGVMQSCWELTPSSRPTFQQLVQFFDGYKKELEETSVSNELDSQLKEAQTKIAEEFRDIYTKCTPDQRNMLDDMIQKLYAPISGIERSKRASVAPATKARKHKNKMKKPEISGPVGNVKHIYSIKVDEESNDKNQFKFYDYSTLPRSLGKNIAALSTSSPNLNLICDLGNVAPPRPASRISRQKAIRKKNAKNTHDMSPTSPKDDEISFAQIDNADDVVLIESTSKDHQPVKNGTLSKVFSKLPWKTKRDSRDDDYSSNPSPITTRSSSSSSNRQQPQIPPIFAGPSSRAPLATSLFHHQHENNSASSRNRAHSTADCFEETGVSRKNKVSPTDRSSRNNLLKHTNLTERFVKEELPSRPAQLPTTHQRKSVLDQPIPTSPNYSPMSVVSRRTTSSIDGPPTTTINSSYYEHIAVPPRNNHIIQPSLSSYIPVAANEPTHYQMRNGQISSPPIPTYFPVGGGCDDYIPVSGAPIGTAYGGMAGTGGIRPGAMNEVNNTHLYNDFLAKFNSLNVVNPQYYQCKPKNSSSSSSSTTTTLQTTIPTRPMTEPIANFDDEPPDHQAPPPPLPPPMAPPTMIAPVIPPREV